MITLELNTILCVEIIHCKYKRVYLCKYKRIFLLFNLNLRGGEELLFRGEIEEPIFCSEERSKNYFVQRGDRRTKIIGAIFFFCAVVGKKNGTRGEEGNKSAVIHRKCRDPVISNPTFHLF